MEIVIDQPHLVDTLRFQLQASRALPQEDILVSVIVTALAPSSDRDRAGLERRIREAQRKLADVQRSFTRIEREEDTAGYERVTLRASARLLALSDVPSGVTSGERITLLAAVVLKSPGLQADHPPGAASRGAPPA